MLKFGNIAVGVLAASMLFAVSDASAEKQPKERLFGDQNAFLPYVQCYEAQEPGS